MSNYPAVPDTGLSWDQLRTLPDQEQVKAVKLSREMYAANKADDYLVRESARRRLVELLRAAGGV